MKRLFNSCKHMFFRQWSQKSRRLISAMAAISVLCTMFGIFREASLKVSSAKIWDYVVLEDFESYADASDLLSTWPVSTYYDPASLALADDGQNKAMQLDLSGGYGSWIAQAYTYSTGYTISQNPLADGIEFYYETDISWSVPFNIVLNVLHDGAYLDVKPAIGEPIYTLSDGSTDWIPCTVADCYGEPTLLTGAFKGKIHIPFKSFDFPDYTLDLTEVFGTSFSLPSNEYITSLKLIVDDLKLYMNEREISAYELNISGENTIALDGRAQSIPYSCAVTDEKGDSVNDQTILWSLDHNIAGVSIDADSGILTIADTVADAAKLTVTAQISGNAGSATSYPVVMGPGELYENYSLTILDDFESYRNDTQLNAAWSFVSGSPFASGYPKLSAASSWNGSRSMALKGSGNAADYGQANIRNIPVVKNWSGCEGIGVYIKSEYAYTAFRLIINNDYSALGDETGGEYYVQMTDGSFETRNMSWGMVTLPGDSDYTGFVLIPFSTMYASIDVSNVTDLIVTFNSQWCIKEASFDSFVLYRPKAAVPYVKTITVTGDSYVTVPASGEAIKHYSAVVKDQFGIAMPSEAAAFSLDSALTGVSISASGVLKVTSAAQEGTVKIIAKSDSTPEKTGEISVFIKKEKDSLSIVDFSVLGNLSGMLTTAYGDTASAALSAHNGKQAVKITGQNGGTPNQWGNVTLTWSELEKKIWAGFDGVSIGISNPSSKTLQIIPSSGWVNIVGGTEITRIDNDGTVSKQTVSEWSIIDIPAGFSGSVKIPLSAFTFSSGNADVDNLNIGFNCSDFTPDSFYLSVIELYKVSGSVIGRLGLGAPKSIGAKGAVDVKYPVRLTFYNTEGIEVPGEEVTLTIAGNPQGLAISGGVLTVNAPVTLYEATIIAALNSNPTIRTETKIRLHNNVNGTVMLIEDFEGFVNTEALSSVFAVQTLNAAKSEVALNTGSYKMSGGKSIKMTGKGSGSDAAYTFTSILQAVKGYEADWSRFEGIQFYVNNPTTTRLEFSLSVAETSGVWRVVKTGSNYMLQDMNGVSDDMEVPFNIIVIPAGFEGYVKIPLSNFVLANWSTGSVAFNKSSIQAISWGFNGVEFNGKSIYIDDIGIYTTAVSTASVVKVLAPTEAAIPKSGSNIYRLTAFVFDQDGFKMPNEAVTWSVSGNAAGVSISQNGVLTVSSAAQHKKAFAVTALATRRSEVKQTISITPLGDVAHTGMIIENFSGTDSGFMVSDVHGLAELALTGQYNNSEGRSLQVTGKGKNPVTNEGWANIEYPLEGFYQNWSDYNGFTFWVKNPNDLLLQINLMIQDGTGEFYIPKANAPFYYESEKNILAKADISSYNLITLPAHFEGYVLLPFNSYELAGWSFKADGKLGLETMQAFLFAFDSVAFHNKSFYLDTIGLYTDMGFAVQHGNTPDSLLVDTMTSLPILEDFESFHNDVEINSKFSVYSEGGIAKVGLEKNVRKSGEKSGKFTGVDVNSRAANEYSFISYLLPEDKQNWSSYTAFAFWLKNENPTGFLFNLYFKENSGIDWTLKVDSRVYLHWDTGEVEILTITFGNITIPPDFSGTVVLPFESLSVPSWTAVPDAGKPINLESMNQFALGFSCLVMEEKTFYMDDIRVLREDDPVGCKIKLGNSLVIPQSGEKQYALSAAFVGPFNNEISLQGQFGYSLEDVYEGISISGNMLTVSSQAKPSNIGIKVFSDSDMTTFNSIKLVLEDLFQAASMKPANNISPALTGFGIAVIIAFVIFVAGIPTSVVLYKKRKFKKTR